jgi:tRNA(adenine34) deaminase
MGMTDLAWMSQAFELAKIAQDEGEVPIGALVVFEDMVIGRGHNQVLQYSDPTAHAEIIAIRQATKAIGNYRLINSTIYTTLEPCCMCAGSMIHARIKRLVFATNDPKAGACGSVYDLLKGFPLNHRVEVSSGIMQIECSHLLKAFFQRKRN